jgi:serine/threonine protein kinase/tetratricopeptide (TPR) repeat protein
MTDLIGRTLGQYQIMEQIGQGGMATVYKAYQPSLDRYVAVKILPPFYAKQSDFVARFEREAKAIANLNHPNILPVHDFGAEGEYSFIAMRYIEGARTLREVMAGRLRLAQVGALMEQVASALEYAHRRGIIHRDVKPTNVLMDGDWALLSDFGLAKIAEGSTRLTNTGAGVGTPAYMSPEQARGLAVDQRTDIYALGIILFEMLTGKIPHDSGTPIGIILRRSSEPLPRPRSLNPAIPELVEQVVLKTLAQRPEHRFASAQAFAAALKTAIGEAGLEEVGVSAPADEEWMTLPSTKIIKPTRPQPEVETPSPEEAQDQLLSEPAAQVESETLLLDRAVQPPAGSGEGVLLRLRRMVSPPLVIGLLLLLLVVAVLGFANREAVRAALFPAPTSFPTPTSPANIANTNSFEATPTATHTPTSTSTPTPTATSLPFAPAGETETLILIAPFHMAEGIIETEPHREIRLAIEEAVSELDLSNLRVEVEAAPLKADDRAKAKEFGEKYKASIVIWGEDTGVRITINYLNLKQPDLSVAEARISETERTQLANPSAYASFVTRDMPAQLAFLSLFTLGQSYYNERNYAEAIRVIERAVAPFAAGIEPPEGVAGAYFRLGWLYQGPMNDPQAAIAAYDQAIKFDPNYSTAYYNRGLAQANAGNPAQAVQDYTKAIALEPDNQFIFYNRGVAYAAAGDLEPALKDFEQATLLKPDYLNAWNNLCWFSSLAGQAAAGLQACERAVELSSGNGNAYDSRGLARALTGDYAGAVEDFRAYLAWAKQNGVAAATLQKREAWVTQLEAGQNPFDPATLEALRNE